MATMKLLLVQASHLLPNGGVFKSSSLVYPSLALPLLAALTPPDIEVELVNEYYESIPFDSDADVVALSVLTVQAPRSWQVAREFRRRGKKVVVGGFHPSFSPEEAAEHADAVVIGEAENVWEELLRDAEHNRLKKFYRSERPADLSKLPVPRYDLINRKGYAFRAMPVQTSRGCPHNCDFCSVTKFYGGKYRFRPVEQVVRDVQAVPSRYVFFVDDNIAASRKYAMELFEALRPLGKIWGSQCNISAADDTELLQAAAESGCIYLFLGIETLNEKALAKIHKGFNKVEKYASQIRSIKEAGIEPIASIIFGLDGDDSGMFDSAYKFLLDNRVAIAYFFILTPVPGSELFNRYEKEGRLLTRDWSAYGGDRVVFRPLLLSPEELEGGFWKTLKRFYSWSSIFRRLVWPPKIGKKTLISLKYNICHRKSLKAGIHPLRG